MRRSLWFAAGASAGVYAAARARRVVEIFTVDGLRDRVGAAVVGARMLRDEVAQGKAEAETELRDRITLGLHERRELLAGPREHDVPPAHAGAPDDPDDPGAKDDQVRPAGRHRQDNQEEGAS